MFTRPSLIAVLVSAVTVSNVFADPQTASRLHWVTNGNVQAAVQVGNTLYVGGTFTRIAPTSNTVGSFYGLATATGAPLPGFPLVDGIVKAIAPDGAGGYYIGGAFTMIGNVARTNLAHVLSDGSVDPGFAPVFGEFPETQSEITSLAVGNSLLFVGGLFNAANGAARFDFAALDLTTGANATWQDVSIGAPPPRILIAGSNVLLVYAAGNSTMEAHDQATGALVWRTTGPAGVVNDAVIAGTRLIVGGQFAIGPLLSLDATTGAIDNTWVPTGPFVPSTSTDHVSALAVFGSTLYVGGTFSMFGGLSRSNAAAVDIPTAAVTSWAPNPDGAVAALATSPAGAIFMGGAFTQVDGEPHEGLVELDAMGSASAWLGNAYSAGVRTMSVSAGTLLVGGQMAITGGLARANLAAFDLSGDAALPWAPVVTDNVTKLESIGGSIFVGTSHLTDPGLGLAIPSTSAFDALTGAALPWTPPVPPTGGLRLLGADSSHVYVTGDFGALSGLVRLDPTSGAMDPSWRPVVSGANAMVIAGDTMYVGGGCNLWSIDVPTGTVSSWHPQLPSALPNSCNASVLALAITGRSVYVASAFTLLLSGNTYDVMPFDAITALPVSAPLHPVPTSAAVNALSIADGQVIIGRDLGRNGLPPARGSGVAAFTVDGQAASWNPGLSRIDTGIGSQHRPGILVTQTDVILLGYQRGGTDPVLGIAVLPRTASPAPTALRGTTVDNAVSLSWDGPTPAAAGYVLDVGSTPHTAEISLPTGSAATSINGLAGGGTYYVRVHSADAPAGPASVPTNQIALVVGCTTPPSAPTRLAATVNGAQVTLSWNASLFSSPTGYLLEAGGTSGASTISATVPGTVTTLSSPAPPGTYFVRARAVNACGQSDTTGEVFFTVGSANTIPAAPANLTATAVNSLVSIQWNPSAGALGYRLEVGSAPGKSDLAVLPLTTTSIEVGGVPPGVYHARVRAGNDAGLSAASAEFVIVVQ